MSVNEPKCPQKSLNKPWGGGGPNEPQWAEMSLNELKGPYMSLYELE